MLELSEIVKFYLRAAATSVGVVEADWVVFVEAAVAGDASCKTCLGVAFAFSQAAGPAPAGVCGSEDAFILVSSSSFHYDIVGNGTAFSLSLPFRFACCSSNCF